MADVVYDFLIVGSGPAAVSAGFPLVRSGKKVLFIEAGESAVARYDRLASSAGLNRSNYEEKFGEDGDFFKSLHHWSPKFRNAEIFRSSQAAINSSSVKTHNFYLANAHITGGFSNIWGGAISLPDPHMFGVEPRAVQKEIIGSYDLVKKDICRTLSTSQAIDTNDQGCPFKVNQKASDANAGEIYFDDTYFGSNITPYAINQRNPKPFNAAITLQTLIQGTSSRLMEQSRVTQFKELSNNLIEVSFVDGSGTRLTVNGGQLILAAGAINSALILCNSIKKKFRKRLLTSPMSYGLIFFPFRKLNPPYHDMPVTSFYRKGPNEVYGNLTPMSVFPSYEYLLRTSLPYKLVENLVSVVRDKSYVFNMYCSSDFSNNKIELEPTSKFTIVGNTASDYQKQLNKTKWLLHFRYCLPLGGIIAPTTFSSAMPGSDVHYGGTIPMRTRPKEMEADWNGKIFGFNNVHCVDGAILPRIAALPHTFLIMANAFRISKKLL